MSWGAQNRSKDAKTPSGSRGRSENPEPGLWPVQPYGGTEAPRVNRLARIAKAMANARIHGGPAPQNHWSRHVRQLCMCVFYSIAAVAGGNACSCRTLRYALEWALGAHSLCIGVQGTLFLSWLVYN
jgi:hypothetical protein